jgi:hypothetical protein
VVEKVSISSLVALASLSEVFKVAVKLRHIPTKIGTADSDIYFRCYTFENVWPMTTTKNIRRYTSVSL